LRSDALLIENEYLQASKNTLDALQDVTGLPRAELESIANEVAYSYQTYDADFFSIRNQLAAVLGSFGVFSVLFWMLVDWIV
jgi:hypothetical protein